MATPLFCKQSWRSYLAKPDTSSWYKQICGLRDMSRRPNRLMKINPGYFPPNNSSSAEKNFSGASKCGMCPQFSISLGMS
jgi:hypothetical protein